MMPPTATRREVIAGLGAGALGTAGLASPASAQEGTDLSDWFSNTSNADKVVDETGASEVQITVGSQANDGAFGFAPAAVRVDPGTTVVWEWTGEGGGHNVVAEDGSFESELTSEAGHTFEWTAEAGVYRYACTPHKSLGMKGAVVVGDTSVSLGGGSTPTVIPDETATATPTPGGEPGRDFDGWLAETSNFHQVVDLRGQDEVEIAVGAKGNGGQVAFDPPAVHISPGTTVVWKWITGGTSHDVVAADGSYGSPDASAEGTTYAVEFDGHGVSKYACSEHSDRGMRGAIIVGQGDGMRVTPLGFGVAAGVGALTVGGLGKLLADEMRREP